MKKSLFLVFFFASIHCFSQPLSAEIEAKLTTLLNQQVEKLSPGLAVGIVREGQTIFTHYGGYANLEHQVKIDSATRFNIASNAKQFVAIMTLHLTKENKLQLDDDFRKYLPEFYPEVKEAITISHLITHRSGIRDIYSLMALQDKTWWAELGYSNKDALELLKQQKTLNFQPESAFLYSNSNYILLTEIIARVSGSSFPEFAQEFFGKAGMPSSLFMSNYMAIIPNKARPYAQWGQWREYPSVTNLHGDGALFTTLEDQSVWEKAVQTGTHPFLSESEITTSQQLIIENTQYGFGLEWSTFKGLEMNFHDGETGAYKATFLRFPSEKLSIVVMSNSGQVGANYLAKQIAEIVIEKEKWKVPNYPQEPEKLEKEKPLKDLLGYYENVDGSVIRFIEQEGKLFWKIGQNRPFEFEAVRKNLYQMTEYTDLKIAFESEGGKVTNMIRFRPEQAPKVFAKYPELTISDETLSAFSGKYKNEEVGTEFTLNYLGNYQFEVSIFRETVQTEMIKAMEIKVQGFTLLLKEEGKINLEDSRTRNLVFVRSDRKDE